MGVLDDIVNRLLPDSLTHPGLELADRRQSQNLDAIIVQSIARELSHLTDQPAQAPEDYFQARPAEGVESTAVLADLFAQCARQLVDFSQVRLESSMPTAVVPPIAGEGCPAALAGSLGDRLGLALSRHKAFRLLERENLRQVIDELDLARAFDGPGDEKLPARGDKPLPAGMVVLSKIRKTDEGYEMLVKLVGVRSGQVVSASMLKIDCGLLER